MATQPVVSIWSYEGRSSRTDYFVVLVITSILGSIAGSLVVGGGAISLFSGALFVAVMWVSLCVCARRLHDIGKSGWWTLLVFVPVANFILALYVLFAPGKDCDNEFGPPTSKATSTPPHEVNVLKDHPQADSSVIDKAVVITQTHTVTEDPMLDPREEFWAQALSECESASMKAGLWAKAFADAAGNEGLTKATYMRLRATQLQEQYVQHQQALKLIRDQEILVEQEKQKTQEAEVAALEAKMTEEERAKARLPKGVCPACDEVIPLASEQCPTCSAIFTATAAWKIKPLTYHQAMAQRVTDKAAIYGSLTQEEKSDEGALVMVLFVLLFLLVLAAIVKS